MDSHSQVLHGRLRVDSVELRSDPPNSGKQACLKKLKTTPTPNENSSYDIKGGGGSYAMFLGSACHIFCRNPLILTDFYAIRTPIVWHILGAYFLQIGGVGVVRIIFNVGVDINDPKARTSMTPGGFRKLGGVFLFSRDSVLAHTRKKGAITSNLSGALRETESHHLRNCAIFRHQWQPLEGHEQLSVAVAAVC